MTMEGTAGRASDEAVDMGTVDPRPSPLSWSPFAMALAATLAVGLPIALWCLVHLDLTELPRQQLWSLCLLGVLVIIGETRPLIASKTYGQGGVTPSTAFTFAILFTWGLVPAVVFHCAASLLSDLHRAEGVVEDRLQRRSVHRLDHLRLARPPRLRLAGLAGDDAHGDPRRPGADDHRLGRLLRRQQRPGVLRRRPLQQRVLLGRLLRGLRLPGLHQRRGAVLLRRGHPRADPRPGVAAPGAAADDRDLRHGRARPGP